MCRGVGWVWVRGRGTGQWQRLAQAEAALQTAVAIDGTRADGVSRSLFLVGVAARIRSVLYAQNEQRLRRALHAWRRSPLTIHFGTFLEEDDIEAVEEERAESAGNPRMLEVVLTHLRPAALQWALNTWSRAAAALTHTHARTAAWNAQLEGKWALQKAFVLEEQSREQLIRSVLRYWTHGGLARVWARWCAWMHHAPPVMTTSPETSPHVRVKLG